MLKVFEQYEYLVFCNLSGIMLRGVTYFGPSGIYRVCCRRLLASR